MPEVNPSEVFVLDVPEADAEVAADRLWQCSPSAVSEQVSDSGRVRLTADVTSGDDLVLEPGWRLERREVSADGDLDRWRDFAEPVRAGNRILLQPAWLPAEPDPGDLVVSLDSGRTFGSGSHPSTRLVAAAIEAHLRAGDSVLDVGSGSGVLSVVAVLLGAGRAVGVDVDPAAVEVGAANAERNGVADRIGFSTTPVGEVEGEFDLVVANIGLGVLTDLAGSISARVRPGGLLVLAGLLDDQADAAAAAYAGFEPVSAASEDGWSAVVLRRHSTTSTTSESETGR